MVSNIFYMSVIHYQTCLLVSSWARGLASWARLIGLEDCLGLMPGWLGSKPGWLGTRPCWLAHGLAGLAWP